MKKQRKSKRGRMATFTIAEEAMAILTKVNQVVATINRLVKTYANFVGIIFYHHQHPSFWANGWPPAKQHNNNTSTIFCFNFLWGQWTKWACSSWSTSVIQISQPMRSSKIHTHFKLLTNHPQTCMSCLESVIKPVYHWKQKKSPYNKVVTQMCLYDWGQQGYQPGLHHWVRCISHDHLLQNQETWTYVSITNLRAVLSTICRVPSVTCIVLANRSHIVNSSLAPRSHSFTSFEGWHMMHKVAQPYLSWEGAANQLP